MLNKYKLADFGDFVVMLLNDHGSLDNQEVVKLEGVEGEANVLSSKVALQKAMKLRIGGGICK